MSEEVRLNDVEIDCLKRLSVDKSSAASGFGH